MLTGPMASRCCLRARDSSSSGVRIFAFDADDGLVFAEGDGLDAEVVEAGGFEVLDVGGELGGAGGEGCALLAEGFGFVAQGAEAGVELGHGGAERGGFCGEACRLGRRRWRGVSVSSVCWTASAAVSSSRRCFSSRGGCELLRRAARCAAVWPL